jgi:hypothetical protein
MTMDAPDEQRSGADVDSYLAAITDPRRRREARQLDLAFREATGFLPQLWPGGVVGYGQVERAGAPAPATGFAPRNDAMELLLVPGQVELSPVLARLGPHRSGRASLYLPRLGATDPDALRELIRASMALLSQRQAVTPT